MHCQRLFVQGQGSQYFEVQPPENDDDPAIVPVNGDAAWARVGEAMAKAWERVEKRAISTIQAGERDEVNPWVERTQWLPYLSQGAKCTVYRVDFCVRDRSYAYSGDI